MKIKKVKNKKLKFKNKKVKMKNRKLKLKDMKLEFKKQKRMKIKMMLKLFSKMLRSSLAI